MALLENLEHFGYGHGLTHDGPAGLLPAWALARRAGQLGILRYTMTRHSLPVCPLLARFGTRRHAIVLRCEPSQVANNLLFHFKYVYVWCVHVL